MARARSALSRAASRLRAWTGGSSVSPPIRDACGNDRCLAMQFVRVPGPNPSADSLSNVRTWNDAWDDHVSRERYHDLDTSKQQESGSETLLATSTLSKGLDEKERQGASRWAARLGLGGLGAGLLAGVALSDEAEHGLPAPHFPWPHEGFFSAYDHAAIRRGHQVYQQVCAACHSVEQLSYRNLVGVAYTEEEAKAMAADVDVTDGPNDEGEMFERPGKLSDKLPKPYPNEEAARFANGGAYPPDLSLITKARHDGQNYVYALLLGYREPPAGISMREGLHYNPYFPGGAIAMPKMLADEGVEYEDGTIATESQQAKDVVTFLAWAAEPEHDERKLMGVKWMLALSIMLCTAGYFKRWKWAPLKSRKIVLDVVN